MSPRLFIYMSSCVEIPAQPSPAQLSAARSYYHRSPRSPLVVSPVTALASCWSPCPQCCYPLVLQEDGGAVYLLAVALYHGCTASAPLRLLTAGPSTWPSDGYQHSTAGPARPAHQPGTPAYLGHGPPSPAPAWPDNSAEVD